jgi:hypothetical protein
MADFIFLDFFVMLEIYFLANIGHFIRIIQYFSRNYFIIIIHINIIINNMIYFGQKLYLKHYYFFYLNLDN